LNFITVETQSI